MREEAEVINASGVIDLFAVQTFTVIARNTTPPQLSKTHTSLAQLIGRRSLTRLIYTRPLLTLARLPRGRAPPPREPPSNTAYVRFSTASTSVAFGRARAGLRSPSARRYKRTCEAVLRRRTYRCCRRCRRHTGFFFTTTLVLFLLLFLSLSPSPLFPRSLALLSRELPSHLVPVTTCVTSRSLLSQLLTQHA